ncbi:hypothetical protein I4U23_019775 [Adineta vaga]|nr:hypothetical protein I4U23_019775 [Adineta vaga]
MYYVPVTDSYWRSPVSYVPIYSTAATTNRILVEDSNARLNNDLTRVQRELADLREELQDLRLEKETCRLCSSTVDSSQCDVDCSICYSRTRRPSYSRPVSPVHYCSICHDYVVDQISISPSPSPRPTSRRPPKKVAYEEDKLSEYLSRQLDLQRLRQRRIPEERPVWIPTAYKHDYPHRRWATRQSYFSEP